MEDTTLFIILAVFLGIGAIGTFVMKSRLSKKGIPAPSGSLAKVLTIVTGFGFFLTAGIMLNPILKLEESGSESVPAGLIFGLVLVAGGVSLYFVNKKAKMSNGEAILLTVFEAIYGILLLVIFVIKLALSFTGFSLGGSSSGSSNTASTTSNLDKTYQENAKKHNEALKEEGNKQAEANAAAMGFDSANEAAAYGIGPGREE